MKNQKGRKFFKSISVDYIDMGPHTEVRIVTPQAIQSLKKVFAGKGSYKNVYWFLARVQSKDESGLTILLALAHVRRFHLVSEYISFKDIYSFKIGPDGETYIIIKKGKYNSLWKRHSVYYALIDLIGTKEIFKKSSDELMKLIKKVQTLTDAFANIHPEIKVILPSNKVVWIEAVTPNIGRTDDSVPPIMYGLSNLPANLPEREFLLRLNVALCDKLDVFKGYLNKGVIKEDDYCIIALSSCALAQYGDLMDFPVSAPLKVLAGCGQLVLSKNGNYVGRRNHIQTSLPGREREVDTCLFDREDFSIISAVLYSHTDILNSPNNPESSFQLFLNPLKVNPDVKSAFGNMEIWFQGSKNGDETIWTKE